MTDFEPLASSNLESYRYDKVSNTLEIKFIGSDRTHSYDNVPQSVVDEFLSSPSRGKFFHSNIKGRY